MDKIRVGLPRCADVARIVMEFRGKIATLIDIRSTHGTGAEMDLSSKIDCPP